MITASARSSRGSAARLVSRTSSSSGRSSASRTSRSCGEGSIAITRGAAPGRPVDEHAGEVAGVGADLHDRARAGRVEAGQQDLGEVLERVRPATGVVGVGVDLRLLPLHERASVSAVPGRGPSATLRPDDDRGSQSRPWRRRALRRRSRRPRATRASRSSTRCGGSPCSPSLVYHVFVFTRALDRRLDRRRGRTAGGSGPLLFFAISGFLLYRPWVAAQMADDAARRARAATSGGARCGSCPPTGSRSPCSRSARASPGSSRRTGGATTSSSSSTTRTRWSSGSRSRGRCASR